MTIVVTGGGSGGHITPILAIAAEIKKVDPSIRVVFVGQKGGKLMDIPENDPNIDYCYGVSAGKFRRYHSEGLKQIYDIKTQIKNFKDLFRIFIGIFQSYRLLGSIKPDIVFTRGGYVSVPVATAAWLRKIPYVTHDSDSTPSLANRIIAPKAAVHAVALDPSIYPYPSHKTVQVGVPISNMYKPVTKSDQTLFKKDLAIEKYEHVVLVTGGGNGAKILNDLVKADIAYLIKKYPSLFVLHFSGRSLKDDLMNSYRNLLTDTELKRIRVEEFVTDFYRYSGASDIVIARGGATNLSEFAAQAKPCIIIPSKQLIWNIRNTEILAKEGAVIELTEDRAEQELRLAHLVENLLEDKQARDNLTQKFIHYYMPDAAKNIAELLINKASSTNSDV